MAFGLDRHADGNSPCGTQRLTISQRSAVREREETRRLSRSATTSGRGMRCELLSRSATSRPTRRPGDRRRPCARPSGAGLQPALDGVVEHTNEDQAVEFQTAMSPAATDSSPISPMRPRQPAPRVEITGRCGHPLRRRRSSTALQHGGEPPATAGGVG